MNCGKIDNYFLSGEERVIEILKRTKNHKIHFMASECEQIFGIEYDNLRVIFSALSKKRLIWFHGGNGIDVKLTEKFMAALEAQIEQ